jgi:hypothetical protein
LIVGGTTLVVGSGDTVDGVGLAVLLTVGVLPLVVVGSGVRPVVFGETEVLGVGSGVLPVVLGDTEVLGVGSGVLPVVLGETEVLGVGPGVGVAGVFGVGDGVLGVGAGVVGVGSTHVSSRSQSTWFIQHRHFMHLSFG